uniref:Uncharacterized protein n=1 Tax=Rousettus aegyptiacus TaxID=9407 RepID=A0A7J8DYA6_ROUAE|nr:hypothetical protein HJG63_008452 [Rousettus aegyptiacus]
MGTTASGPPALRRQQVLSLPPRRKRWKEALRGSPRPGNGNGGRRLVGAPAPRPSVTSWPRARSGKPRWRAERSGPLGQSPLPDSPFACRSRSGPPFPKKRPSAVAASARGLQQPGAQTDVGLKRAHRLATVIQTKSSGTNKAPWHRNPAQKEHFCKSC